MIIQPLRNFREKLGRFYLPLLMVLFFVLSIGIMFSSVKQNNVDYSEGQVAEENIRANKTIENTTATEQKRTLAAEAVSPEYTYQDDLAQVQHERINHLFELIDTVNKTVNTKYEAAVKAAGENENVPKPDTEEYIATLKKEFEKMSDDELDFYQALTNNFLSTLFSLNSDQLNTVRDYALQLVDEQMAKQIRQSELSTFRSEAEEKIQFLDVTSEMATALRFLVNQGIVVNDFPNEKRTEEARQAAKDAVQPVMIYQGEIIVREGSQIDSNALEKLQLLGLTSQTFSVFPLIALVFTAALQMLMLFYYTRQTKNEDKRMNAVTFYVIAMIFSILLMKFFQLFQSELIAFIPLFFPAAFTPLILNIFSSRRLGILAAMFQVINAIFIYFDSSGTNMLTTVLVTYLFSGLMGTMIRRERIASQGRTAIMWVIVFPFLLSVMLVIFQGMDFARGNTWTTIICALAGSLLSYLLTIGLHQYIELLVSDNSMIVLNELSNPNHPLLKQLLEEAPGTYHHSMMVANLSANAVAEIGGQSLLTRVACYYHDIGKLKHANFFVENLPAGAENPHNFLLPEDSKQIIFGHVIDGAVLLENEKMPQMVVDICRQHHGTTLMRYFYVKAKERNQEVTEADFRYPGPKPQTREAGVVSIADSCEAAVRAMDNPTDQKIKEFVSNLINDRILDGQLDESGLTLHEIRIIEKSLVNGLCSTFHSRIKYPKMKSEAEKMKEEQERRDR